jgi:hypothetical protein
MYPVSQLAAIIIDSEFAPEVVAWRRDGGVISKERRKRKISLSKLRRLRDDVLKWVLWSSRLVGRFLLKVVCFLFFGVAVLAFSLVDLLAKFWSDVSRRVDVALLDSRQSKRDDLSAPN